MQSAIINYSANGVGTWYNVQSFEGLPFPNSGPVPVVAMILYFGEQEETVRALLDTGSTLPSLSLGFVEEKQVPIAERATKRTIEDYAGQEGSGAGEYFTSPLLLQHRHHYTRVSFEVAPLAGDYDVILPRWWLAKHKCDLLACKAESSSHQENANANAPEKETTLASR